jgi:hypothetical protein
MKPELVLGTQKPSKYTTTIHTKDGAISSEFAELVLELEKLLERKIWLLVQGVDEDDWGTISARLYQGFHDKKDEILPSDKIGLLIHSFGGQSDYAYKIVRLFQRRTDDFVTIVPLAAKSAATLMAIGGKTIVMGMDAELGPIDVQTYDDDKGIYVSALNTVQSLERLNVSALTSLDQLMQLLVMRTGKKPEALMSLACSYATNIVRPLMEKIDTIELTRMSRELKVAEDYAVRLMRGHYTSVEAQHIAMSLVSRYSTHGFVIDQTEAGNGGSIPRKPLNLGLHLSYPKKPIEELFTKLERHLEKLNEIGRIVEISDEKGQ